MRRFFGLLGLLLIATLFVLMFVLPIPHDASSAGIWDVLGPICLAGYFLSAVIVFVDMVTKNHRPTSTLANKGALIFWVLLIICAAIPVFILHVNTGSPDPFLITLAAEGVLFLCPAIIAGDWLLP